MRQLSLRVTKEKTNYANLFYAVRNNLRPPAWYRLSEFRLMIFKYLTISFYIKHRLFFAKLDIEYRTFTSPQTLCFPIYSLKVKYCPVEKNQFYHFWRWEGGGRGGIQRTGYHRGKLVLHPNYSTLGL
jgi:hypothetical protein